MRCFYSVPVFLALFGCTTAPPADSDIRTTVQSAVRQALPDDPRADERSFNVRRTLGRLKARLPYVGHPASVNTFKEQTLADLNRLVLSDSERADAVAVLNSLPVGLLTTPGSDSSAPALFTASEMLTLIIESVPEPTPSVTVGQ